MGADKLTTPRSEIRNFGCADPRVNDQGWEFAVIGAVHRDSETIDRSNARVLHKMMEGVDPDQEHWGILKASHWAVGWIDHLIVDPNHAPVMTVLREAKEGIDGYPILDSDDHSALELEEHEAERCDGHCSFCEYEREDARRTKGSR